MKREIVFVKYFHPITVPAFGFFDLLYLKLCKGNIKLVNHIQP